MENPSFCSVIQRELHVRHLGTKRIRFRGRRPQPLCAGPGPPSQPHAPWARFHPGFYSCGVFTVNTPIHWCSTIWHGAQPVSRSYCCVKYTSGRQASLCFSVQVFFLDFHLQYNSVLSAKIIMFQHLHSYYADETRMLYCLCQITSFPPPLKRLDLTKETPCQK